MHSDFRETKAELYVVHSLGCTIVRGSEEGKEELRSPDGSRGSDGGSLASLPSSSPAHPFTPGGGSPAERGLPSGRAWVLPLGPTQAPSAPAGSDSAPASLSTVHGIKWTCSNGNSSSGFSVEQLVQQILDSHQTKPQPRTHNCLCTGSLGEPGLPG